jgi:recombination protein RecT
MGPTEQNQLARQETAQQEARRLTKAPRNIRELLDGPEIVTAIQKVMVSKAKAERFVRVALTATMRTPEMLDCTKESFFKCLLDLSAFGLEPDGRRAHLIPFNNYKLCHCGHEKDQHNGPKCIGKTAAGNCQCQGFRHVTECTLVIDYRGLIDCVRRSGEVSYIHCDYVVDGDEFDYQYGTGAFLKHRPDPDARSEFADLPLTDKKRRITHVYSFVRLKDGAEDFLVFSPGEVEKVRMRSRAADSGPWSHKDDYMEMAKKTVFRNHSKWLPFSSETRDLIERDDDAVDVSAAHVLESTARLTALPEGLRPSSDPKSGHDRTLPAPADGEQQQPRQQRYGVASAKKRAEKGAATSVPEVREAAEPPEPVEEFAPGEQAPPTAQR